MVEATHPATRETEQDLIDRAQEALNQCNWVIGECAAQWTRRYAKGRTDADFGARIGLSGDQVYQRRRVWETFSDVRNEYQNVKWSHFYAALNWDDAAECLQWADEMQATVAEMKAWRRAQRGEDLTRDSAEEEVPFAESGIEYLSPRAGMVREPADESNESSRGGGGARETDARDQPSTVAAAARGTAEEQPYSPFGKDARGPAPGETGSKPARSTDAVLRSLAAALEKCDKAMTPAVLEDFPQASAEIRKRFLTAIKSLSLKSAGLK
jgi:hypothetical protein